MKPYTYLFFIACAFLISCDKTHEPEEPVIDWQDITVGEEKDCIILDIYDTIAPTGSYDKNTFITLDVNQDSIDDLEISAYNESSAGGYSSGRGSGIKTLNGCEIIADSLISTIYTFTRIEENGEIIEADTAYSDQPRLLPISLPKNFLIENSCSWQTGKYLSFCFSSFSVNPIGDNQYKFRSSFDEGWVGEGVRYLGFRIHTTEMTFHGYLELEVPRHGVVIINRAIYR